MTVTSLCDGYRGSTLKDHEYAVCYIFWIIAKSHLKLYFWTPLKSANSFP